MKKLITAIALIIVIVIALFPPVVEIGVPLTSSKLWLWLVLLFGFLGLYTVTLKINPWIKAIAVYSFISLFFSTAPFFSQFAYMELIGCIYLYAMLLTIEDWDLVYKVLWCILGINIILLIMQFFHKDNILNFGLASNTCSMSVGNLMQAKSFIIIMIALLIQKYRGIERYLYAIYLILAFLALVYWVDHKCWDKFCYARGAVWLEGLRLSLKHPFFGWGEATWKVLFPALGKGKFVAEGNWYNAHDFFIQILFENGIIGLCLIIGFVINLFKKCRDILLLGAILVMYPLLFHFPDRQPSSVPLLILFCVYCERFGVHYQKETILNSQGGYHA